ncbi:hypothetical protein V8E53_007042, partial [Lactarius tabidus]
MGGSLRCAHCLFYLAAAAQLFDLAGTRACTSFQGAPRSAWLPIIQGAVGLPKSTCKKLRNPSRSFMLPVVRFKLSCRGGKGVAQTQKP